MKDNLQRLVGRKLVAARAIDDESIVLEFERDDGDLPAGPIVIEIYHAYHEPIAVRIEGKYIPPEEL